MRRRRPAVALAAVASLVLAACATTDDVSGAGGPAAGAPGGEVRIARASWDTGWFQAAVYAELLDELGYSVTGPAELTRDANTFYPALAQSQVDLWANGWFPLHDIYFQRPVLTGQEIAAPIERVGVEVRGGARQGYLIDKKTADELGITTMSDFTDPQVAQRFDLDGDGRADLLGCNEGWGCNLKIEEHIAKLDWGPAVEQVEGEYSDLVTDVVQPRVEAGQPVLFYTWTPNWTIDRLKPGQDVVWLESPALAGDLTASSVEGLAGCAGADPCELGWPVNDIRAVANTDFLEANPPVRRLLEAVQIPLADIAAQNARMAEIAEYPEEAIEDDALEWIDDHRQDVARWLRAADG